MDRADDHSKARILELLERVKDTEVPAISVLELGVVREVSIDPTGKVTVTITPTYTGCPAMDVMVAADIKQELLQAGISEVEVKLVLSLLGPRIGSPRKANES